MIDMRELMLKAEELRKAAKGKEHNQEDFNEKMEKILETLDYLVLLAAEMSWMPMSGIFISIKSELLNGPDKLEEFISHIAKWNDKRLGEYLNGK